MKKRQGKTKLFLNQKLLQTATNILTFFHLNKELHFIGFQTALYIQLSNNVG